MQNRHGADDYPPGTAASLRRRDSTRQRHAGSRARAGAGRRADVERAADRLDPFAHADQAEPLPQTRVDVEPDAVVGDRQRETVRHRPPGARRPCAARAVLEGILQRLLHDAEQTQRHVGRQRCRDALVRERDRRCRPRHLALESPERRRPGRSAGAWPDAGGARGRARCSRWSARAVQRLAGSGSPSAVHRRSASSSRSIVEQRHLLADVVVQLAGDPRPLGFLRVEQARRRDRGCARSCVRSAASLPRTCASACRRRRRCTSSPAIRSRLGQRALAPRQGCRRGSGPRRTARWNMHTRCRAGTRDSLMPQRCSCRQSTWLTFRSGVAIGMRVGGSPRQHPQGQRAERVDLDRLILQAPADDAAVHRRVDPGVDRDVRIARRRGSGPPADELMRRRRHG